MSFVDRVIADLNAHKHERAFETLKPRGSEMLFSVGYNTNHRDVSAWSITTREGFLRDRVVLNRGQYDDIPLSRAERQALYSAYKAAMKYEIDTYKLTLGVLRS